MNMNCLRTFSLSLAALSLPLAASADLAAQDVSFETHQGGDQRIPERTRILVKPSTNAAANATSLVVGYLSVKGIDPKSWGGQLRRVMPQMTHVNEPSGAWADEISSLLGNIPVTAAAGNQHIPAQLIANAVSEAGNAALTCAQAYGTANQNGFSQWPIDATSWPTGASTAMNWLATSAGVGGNWANTRLLIREFLRFQSAELAGASLTDEQLFPVVDMVERGMGDISLHIATIELGPGGSAPTAGIKVTKTTKVTIRSFHNVVDEFRFYLRFGAPTDSTWLYPVAGLTEAKIEAVDQPDMSDVYKAYVLTTNGYVEVDATAHLVLPPPGSTAPESRYFTFPVPPQVATGEIVIMNQTDLELVQLATPNGTYSESTWLLAPFWWLP